MKISLGLVTSMPLKEGIRLATFAEERGFYRCFVGEDILSRELFTYLSVLALKTRRIGLVSGITSPYVRNLAVLASSVFSLQRLCENRFDLGLGPSGLHEVVRSTGTEPRRPVGILRETVILTRRLLRGDTVTYKSVDRRNVLQGFRLRGNRVRIPRIYLGVRGPKLLALAGEVADGVIFSGSKRRLREALRIVETSATQASRNPEDLERILWIPFIEARDSVDFELARTIVATIISNLPQREVKAIPSLSKLAHDLREVGYEEVLRCITDEMVREFCLVGSVEELIDETQRLEGEGFQELVIGPPFGTRPEKTLESISNYLRGALDEV